MPARRLAGGPCLHGGVVMAKKKDGRGVVSRILDTVRGQKKATKQKTTAKKLGATPPTPLPALVTAFQGARRPAFTTGDHPLMHGHPPDWASGWGEDRYGVFVELTLGVATQRMRWIGPGRFRMGSPEEEPGRYGKSEYNEGPQHEVRISEGFWLFDTPVTQALWEAVMGGNPSRFADRKRPVEQVSWDEASEFLQKINSRIPGLELVLPTEAQWEYACRAGTETATYVGPIDILGDNNAPILDAIAWYGGNSGVGFELESGYDSSDWPGKQYDHSRAGTHPVGQKLPNGWGLYDMLGNVWEWCADNLRSYGADPVSDPVGSLDSAQRALRGGSWGNDARNVRAAYRYACVRDDRDISFGFRCARVRL